MDWLDLHAFITIAREKSISKASQTLHLTQPTLTARIKKLEQELGVELLKRSWKGIILTRFGTLFLIHAIKIIHEMDDISTLLKKLNVRNTDQSSEEDERYKHKKLKIGISRPLGPSFFTPILIELSRSHPNLRYDIISELPEYILDLVAIGEIHIGIVPYMENRPDLISMPVFEEEMVLLGPKNDTEACIIDLKDTNLLLQKPFILLRSWTPLRTLTDRILIEFLGKMPMDIQEANDPGVVLSMVSNGLGYTVLPTSFISPQKLHDGLPYQIFRLGSNFPARKIHLVYSASYQFSLTIHDIAEMISSPYKTMMGNARHSE